jgi:hypothetical protein
MASDVTHVPKDLPDRWRERAAFLREYGDANGGRLWELAALELRAALAAHNEATLSLSEAARASGYSADHLGRLVKRGVIPNAGRAGAPRLRRADVPIKAPNGPGRPSRESVAKNDPACKHAKSVARAFSRKR